jgi:hypothetical protein
MYSGVSTRDRVCERGASPTTLKATFSRHGGGRSIWNIVRAKAPYSEKAKTWLKEHGQILEEEI